MMRTKIAALTAMLVFTACATVPSRPAPPPQERATLLVVNQGSQTLSFVDAQTLEVRRTIPMAPAPHEIAAAPDGRTAYVSLYGNREVVGDSIAVIDVGAQAEAFRFKVGGEHRRPHGIAYRDGSLFATAEMDRALLRLDPKTGVVRWSGATGGAGSHMLALSPDGKRVYCGNIGSNSVSIVDIDGEPVRQIAVGKGPEGIALTPDGRELWVAQRGEGGVAIIDTRSEKVVATILPHVVSARVAISPDGGRVLLFDMASRNVVVVDRASRQEVGRIQLEGMPGGGIVSLDSRTAFVSVYEPFSVTRIDLVKMVVTGHVETGIAPDGMVLVKEHMQAILAGGELPPVTTPSAAIAGADRDCRQRCRRG